MDAPPPPTRILVVFGASIMAVKVVEADKPLVSVAVILRLIAVD